jgi:K+-sensing histidine kinase KdpD
VFNSVLLLISVLAGSSISLFLLFNSLRTEAKLAGDVISELKQGNLKARMPIRKMDEVGKLMHEFNRMADEIDRLVHGIKASEQSRMSLLQELAHDLRTPVASLKNLLETIQDRDSAIDPSMRAELMSLSLREVEYFERLVEDLLLLAQVTEPKYSAEKARIDIADLLEEELERVNARYVSIGRKVSISKHIPEHGIELSCDSHLIRRMFRNGLENAFSFANHKVEITVHQTQTSVTIRIVDDGPGLTREALASYGLKRITRQMNEVESGRLSVGLGSVIIKAIAQAHGGEATIANRTDTNEAIVGAELTITLIH